MGHLRRHKTKNRGLHSPSCPHILHGVCVCVIPESSTSEVMHSCLPTNSHRWQNWHKWPGKCQASDLEKHSHGKASKRQLSWSNSTAGAGSNTVCGGPSRCRDVSRPFWHCTRNTCTHYLFLAPSKQRIGLVWAAPWNKRDCIRIFYTVPTVQTLLSMFINDSIIIIIIIII